MKKIICLFIFSLLLVGCTSNKGVLKEEEVKTTSRTTTTVKACKAKKFGNDYTFVFDTEKECEYNANEAVNYMIDNVDDEVYFYSCEKIIDDCDNEYYGIKFVKWNGKKDIDIYY